MNLTPAEHLSASTCGVKYTVTHISNDGVISDAQL